MAQQAFILRIAPSGNDRVAEALHDNEAIIGWAESSSLLDPQLKWEEFRGILRRDYYATEKNLRRAGSAAGNMWRFLREMQVGDLIVTPHGPGFYVGQIEGDATHDPSKVSEDTAFRRRVTWLNEKQPIPRDLARASLQSRMKTYGTCAYATDLLADIHEALSLAERKEKRAFESDLQGRLVQEALDEIRSGRIDSFGFEGLVRSVLLGLGAQEARIVPRNEDKGADILASFSIAGAFQFLVAVQAKHYRPDPPAGAEVVKQLIEGVEAEDADLGMVVTSGSFSKEATDLAAAYYEEKGIEIQLVDGSQLAALIVERGLRKTK